MTGRMLGYHDLLYICEHYLDQVRPAPANAGPPPEQPSLIDPAVKVAKDALMALPMNAPAEVRREAERALRHARQHAFDE